MKQLGILSFCLLLLSSINAQEIKYGICKDCWNTDSLGNHRAVIRFNGDGKIAKLVIPWRRKDSDAANKRVIFQDAKTSKKILNHSSISINRESASFYFEPVSGKGTYYLYYMPYKNEGRSNYPKGNYLKPEITADPAWLEQIKSSVKIQEAIATEIQSIDSLNSFIRWK